MSEEIKIANISDDIVQDDISYNNEIIELIEIVKTQTNINDSLLIERTLMECSKDVPRTILTLLKLLPTEIQKEPTDIDLFREILNEKDRIYHDIMEKNKQ
jgi:hypothetical protein